MTDAESIASLDAKPEPNFLWGDCRAYRVTSDRHLPRYAAGDVVLTDHLGRVLGFVPAAARVREAPVPVVSYAPDEAHFRPLGISP
jgi:hypothetical protein